MNRLARHATTTAGRVAVVIIASCLSSVVHASPAAEGAHGGEHAGGHIEWITPVFGHQGNLGMVWAFINFAVLMWLLNKLLFTPLRKRTRDKHEAVRTEIDMATRAREEAESVLADYKGRIERLDAEIAELMADAKAKAEADRARIIAAAEREAEQIKTAATAAAEREAAARRRQLEAEIVDRAVARAETIIRETITPADQRGMVEQYVDQLSGVEFGGR